MKSAQGTIRILIKSEFYLDLTIFLTIIGGGGGAQFSIHYCRGGGAQPNIGRLGHSQRDIKLLP